jgi:hypothetical protein
LAKGAVATPVATFAISSQTATTLDTIKFTRTGLGAASDYNNVYIYNNGTRLKSGRAISSDNQTVEFTNVALAIPANTIVNLTVAVDVLSTATTGDVNVMGIASAADVKFVGGATPNGSFPLNGNAMTISAVSVGTATITPGSVPSAPSIGATEALVGEMKIAAGADDVTLDKVTFTQNGTISSTNLSNITLKIDGTVLATTASMTGDRVALTLTTPYTIGKNKNKTFGIYADITGGKKTDSIRFYLDELSDIVITDLKYNQGALVTNNAVTGLMSTHTSYVAALQGGEITITDKGPAANTIARNKTDVELLRFGVTTSRNVTVKDYQLTLDKGVASTNSNSTVTTGGTYTIGTSDTIVVGDGSKFAINDYIIVGTTASSAGGAIVPATDMIAKVTAVSTNTLTITPVEGTSLTAEATDLVSVVEKITAIRLVNVDTGSVVYSDSTNRYFYNGSNGDAVVTVSASDDFDLNIGTAYTFAVRVDISEYAAPDMELVGGFSLNNDAWVKDYDANEYVTAANIVPSSITGKNMTIGASSLTVAKASTPVSTSKVKGTQGVELLGVSMNTNSSGDVKVTQVVVRFEADAVADGWTGNVFTSGDTAANTLIDSVSLYDGSTQIGTSKSLAAVADPDAGGALTAYYKATFDNLSYTIPAGSSKKLTVKANLKGTVSASAYVAANIVPATDITAKDTDGNTLTLTGAVNDSAAVKITVTTAGSLALKAEGSPSAAIVAAGATNVVMSKYKLSATNEAYTLDKLSIVSDSNGGAFATVDATLDNNITQVGIRVNGGTPVKANLSAGVANFSNLAVKVPADGYVYIEVLADFNTIAGGATTGATPRLGVSEVQDGSNTFRAVGEGSSTTANYATTDAVTGTGNVYAMTVRKTFPTIAKHAGMSSTLTNGTNALYAFDVAADSHEAVALKRVALTFQGSTELVVNALRLYRGTTDITTNVSIYEKTDGAITDIADAATKTIYIAWKGTTEEVIPAGQTYVYTIYAAVQNTSSNKYVTSYIADDLNVLTTTTGADAILSTNTASGFTYIAESIAVAAGDYRVSGSDSYTAANAGGGGDGLTSAGTTVLSKYGNDVADASPLFTYDGTSWAYTSGEANWSVDASSSSATGFTATNTDGRHMVVTGITGAANEETLTVAVTKDATSSYTAGSLVATGQTDIGLAVTTTAQNFIWSDNSDTSHNVTTTSDWTNGYLVDNLSTSLLSLTAN